MLEFFEWLERTPGSIWIRESIWSYPLVETTHVLALGMFLGLVALLDLRLLGLAFARVPVSRIAGRLLPWALLGFGIMVASGLLLFYSGPVTAATNVFFRIKIVMIILAGANAFVFHSTVYRRASHWDLAPIAPLRARVAGALSLALWAGVVAAGRLQAYNWFD